MKLPPKDNKAAEKDFYKKDPEQLELQKLIENHYPEPEKYQILESVLNKLTNNTK